MNRVLTALVCMDPERLASAADELDSLRASGAALPGRTELLRIRRLAGAAAEHWRQAVSLAALSSGGYSASGDPAPVSGSEGGAHG